MGDARGSQEGSHELRLFCVCGQKMRVVPDMFGKPGKCIACRQKIRIPDRDEVPEGVSVIDLTEHPEFLRASRTERAESSPQPARAAEGLIEPAEDEGEERMALDVLEPLKALASVEYRLKHKLDVLRSGGATDDAALSEDDLRETVQQVRERRAALNEQLEQVCTDVEEQLSGVRRELSGLENRGRSGTMTFREYQAQARALRRQRDALARREWNLRGWLSARTPFDAGGYVRLPLDHVPELPEPLLPPDPPEPTGNLTAWWVERLRRAFDHRADADRAYVDAGRAEKSANASPDDALRRADAQSDRARWDANIAFCRERLRRRKDDLRTDAGVVQDMADLLQGRFDVSEIDRKTFEERQRTLDGVQRALRDELEQVNRALLANAPTELPGVDPGALGPMGSTPSRGMPRRTQRRWGTDAALTGLAALVLVATLFVPLVGGLSVLGAALEYVSGQPAAALLVIAPLGGAVVAAVLAALPFPPVRGMVTLALSCLLFLGSIVFFQQMAYAHGDFGQALRAEESWVLQPGVLTFYVGLVALLLAAGLGLSKHESLWAAVPVAAVATAVMAAAVLFMGPPATVLPVVSQPEFGETAADGTRAVRLVVSNPTRDIVVVAVQQTLPDAVDLQLERLEGTASWVPASEVEQIQRNAAAEPETEERRVLELRPGMSAALLYRLSPGAYRVVLGGAEVQQFEVEGDRARVAPGSETPAGEPPNPDALGEPAVGPGEQGDAPVEPPATAGEPPAEPAGVGGSDQGQSGTEPPSEPSGLGDEPGLEETPTPPPADGEPAAADSEGPAVTAGTVEAVLKGMLVVDEGDPRFTFVLEYSDGRKEEVSAGLNDLVVGRWKVSEYNPAQQTVTLSGEDEFFIMRRQREYALPLR